MMNNTTMKTLVDTCFPFSYTAQFQPSCWAIRHRLRCVHIHLWTLESPATNVNITAYLCTSVSFPIRARSWGYSIFPAQTSCPHLIALGRRTPSLSASTGWAGGMVLPSTKLTHILGCPSKQGGGNEQNVLVSVNL